MTEKTSLWPRVAACLWLTASPLRAAHFSLRPGAPKQVAGTVRAIDGGRAVPRMPAHASSPDAQGVLEKTDQDLSAIAETHDPAGVKANERIGQTFENSGRRGDWGAASVVDVSAGQAAVAAGRDQPTPQPTKRPHDPAALDRLLAKVSRAAAKAAQTGKQPIVLFDIDDTLTDSGARNLRILKEFIAQPDVQAAHPQDAAKLEKILTLAQMRYYYSDTFLEVGVHNPALLGRLQTFWKSHFFRNDYIPEDPAYPGAAAFVKEVVARGGIPVYLTGRWMSGATGSMEPGTLAGLAKHGFPRPDGINAVLMLKPDEAQADADFKAGALKQIAGMGEVVGGFENEPKNINIFKARFPSGQMIFLDTKTAAEKDPATQKPIDVAGGIAWVGDFVRPRPAPPSP